MRNKSLNQSRGTKIYLYICNGFAKSQLYFFGRGVV